jgi:hypothetical protein
LSSASWPSLGPSPLLPFFPPTLQVACSIHVEPTIYANATLKVSSLFLEVSTFQESETFLLRASNSDADTCLESPESQLKLYWVLLDSNQPLRWCRYRIYDIESTSRHLRTLHDGGLTFLIHAAKQRDDRHDHGGRRPGAPLQWSHSERFRGSSSSYNTRRWC